jgi:hypothetical protein
MNIQMSDELKLDSATNRRAHVRVKENRQITLVRLNDSGNIVSHQPEKANVLDLSMGGMRVNSRELLLNDSLVQFNFLDENLPPQLQSGIAKVRWSCPIHHNTQFQMGLAFQSDQTMKAIGEHLGHSM